MSVAYFKLTVAAILPVVLSTVLYTISKKTKFKNVDRKKRAVIYGVAFGLLAILGNEWGISVDGVTINVRDGAVVAGGLLFGPTAGIIAGLMGGVERWLCVYWGGGTFTRVACALSTCLAGVIAALLRKYFFADKRANPIVAAFFGVVVEVFHLSMVFFTHPNQSSQALSVVEICTAPMLIAAGASVGASVLCVDLLAKKFGQKKPKKNLSNLLQRGVLLTVVCAFIFSYIFTYQIQSGIAKTQSKAYLTTALDENENDIKDVLDERMVSIASSVSEKYLSGSSLSALAQEYKVSEISQVNEKGIILDSTNPHYKGYDMSQGEQSSAFLVLLNGVTSYVQEFMENSYDGTEMKYAGVANQFGFIQVGYNRTGFLYQLGDILVDVTKNCRIGESGFVLVLNYDGDILSAPEDYATRGDLGLDADWLDSVQDGVMIKTMACGVDSYCMARKEDTYMLLAVYPMTEALNMRDSALYINSFLEIMIFAVVLVVIYFILNRRVVSRLGDVNRSLQSITEGNLNARVTQTETVEFEHLSDSINKTVDTLKEHIVREAARIDEDLEFAKNIQSSALPNRFPAYPQCRDFDIYASMEPAKMVGGDFYDFYFAGENRFNILIADVSGKGIPAAMFMMRAKAELKTLREENLPIEEVFTKGNSNLCEGNDAGMFVTAWQGGINLKTGRMDYANAGHNPPLVKHFNGPFEYLRNRSGFILAGMEGVKYKPQNMQLKPGDVIFLYTDGVTEAMNKDGELYGDDRLLKDINGIQFSDMKNLCERLRSKIDMFVGDAEPADDMTMLAFEYRGQLPDPQLHFDDAEISDVPKVMEFVEKQLEELGYPYKTIMQINIAIDEIFSNIVKYAYRDKEKVIDVIFTEKHNEVHLTFVDFGRPYNPLTNVDPDITLSAEERSIGGLGIYMVKKSMDELNYRYENDSNIVTIIKRK